MPIPVSSVFPGPHDNDNSSDDSEDDGDDGDSEDDSKDDDSKDDDGKVDEVKVSKVEDSDHNSDEDGRHDDVSVVIVVVPTSFLQDWTTSTSPSLETANSRLNHDGDGWSCLDHLGGLEWCPSPETPHVSTASRHWTCLQATRGESWARTCTTPSTH